MVSLDHKGGDAVFCELAHGPLKGQFTPQAPVGAVVEITGNDQKIDLAVDAEGHHAIEGLESGSREGASHGVVGGVHAAEGGVEVEVRGVNKTNPPVHGQSPR